MEAPELNSKNQIGQVTSFLGWGLSLAGIGLFVVTILKGIILFAHQEAIPWGVVGANLTIAFVLTTGGTWISYGHNPLREKMTILASWMNGAVLILGACLLVRFVSLLYDLTSMDTAPAWATEVFLAALGLACVAIGILNLRKTSQRAGPTS